jgi:hypothetical protein
MNTLMKSLGIILILIGVGILAIPVFTEMRNNNGLLAAGLISVVIGVLAHIFLNRRFE